MEEYKISNRHLITDVLTAAFVIILLVILWSGLVIVISAIMLFALLWDLIVKISTRYTISDTCLEKKTLLKKETLIHWKDVHTVAVSAYGKKSIGVFTSTKKFIINPAINNYKEMIKSVVRKCEDNTKVKIDPKVLEV